MSIVRRIARPMMAGVFITGGLDALRHPGSRLPAASPFLHKIAEPLGLPDDPELLIRANAAAMMAGGALLATGRFPRIAAITLIGSMAPTTYAAHAFWSEDDPQARSHQRTQFLKNLAIIGGLVLAAVDTEGKPGVAWRTKHAAEQATKSARRQAKTARRQAKLTAKSL